MDRILLERAVRAGFQLYGAETAGIDLTVLYGHVFRLLAGDSPDPAADSRQEADAVKAPVPEQAIPTEENGASEPVKEETPESMMEKAD